MNQALPKIIVQMAFVVLILLSAMLLCPQYKMLVITFAVIGIVHTTLDSKRPGLGGMRFIDWFFILTYWALMILTCSSFR